MLASVLGGPVGMGGYVFSIRYLGVSCTTMLSAIYPAIGAFLSFVFLKERLRKVQAAGLVTAIAGMGLLGLTLRGNAGINLAAGCISIAACVLGWSLEIVLCAYAMKEELVESRCAYAIRQLCSSVVQFVFLVAVFRDTAFLGIYPPRVFPVIALAGLAGVISYMCYYRAISTIGVSRAMALNITYAAWGIVFDAILLHNMPSVWQIMCGILIIAGALTTARDPGR